MIEGGGTKPYAVSKQFLYSNQSLCIKFLAKVTAALIGYMKEQIRAGVNAVQIFDSWAAALEEQAYFEFGFSYINKIVDSVKAEFPHIPVIVFPKGISGYLDKISGNFDVLAQIGARRSSLQKKNLVQDTSFKATWEPTRLYSKKAIDEGVDKILSTMKGAPHIFNLGHGILPDVPVETQNTLSRPCKQEGKVI